MTVAAVVVAAGQGLRFGAPKQFALLGTQSVARHSIEAARSVASLVVLVVPSNYDGNGDGADVVTTGGRTRGDSVRAGLAYCSDADVVVVHDAARPLASPALFRCVVDAVLHGADAAIPGLPVTDTVKRVVHEVENVVVTDTVPREDLVTVQTPQAFRRDVLERAHASATNATDDAALVEAIGGRVVIVAGEPQNLKITVPGDLEQVAQWQRSNA